MYTLAGIAGSFIGINLDPFIIIPAILLGLFIKDNALRVGGCLIVALAITAALSGAPLHFTLRFVGMLAYCYGTVAIRKRSSKKQSRPYQDNNLSINLTARDAQCNCCGAVFSSLYNLCPACGKELHPAPQKRLSPPDFIKRKAIDTQRRELDTFIRSLMGMGSDELAMLAIQTAVCRHTLEINANELGLPRGVSLLEPFSYLAADNDCVIKLNRILRLWQKDGNLAAAAGLMPWIHTLRGVVSPELRYAGRAMWKEIARGFSNGYAAGFSTDFPVSVWSDYDSIPEGFEPEHY